MIIGLFPHAVEIMSLLLCATMLHKFIQKSTLPSTIYPSLRGEAIATNRRYFVAAKTGSLVNWGRSNNLRGMK